MSKGGKLVILFLVFLFLVGGGYLYLGGWKKTEFELIPCQPILLAGLEFRGTPGDERLGKVFQQVESFRFESPLHTIYFVEPSGKRDTLHVFVGIEVREGVPEEWIQKRVDCKEAVKASLKMHQWVMPSPENTKQLMSDFASSKGRSLDGIFIDKIIDRDWVEVWAPLKD
ncbi:hypothetical protein [Cyclobacterium jeungdonense]|uniref:AraC family transcriptional regulator n=1 Tax=Cyclobacterium jeungdonense TaxID=708087 RepID=A0ABT8C1G4_9BACT|nr:hypothetical protein [Cyclobacterium jeungdonense]MDN3686633.1 hypothetical protein [Cyclobacterium jeungdonense]